MNRLSTLAFIVLIIFLSTIGHVHSALASIPTTEREALIALYNSTDGDNWTDNSGWKTPPLHTDGFAMPGTEDTWYGIIVSNDSVTSVSLVYNQLTGGMPSELGNLANLQNLDLSINQLLTGSMPSELGNLENLQNLDLSINQLNGSIPEELGNLFGLRYLNLSSNQLTGSIPPELENLDNLLQLYLYSNLLTGSIPPQLANLNNLEVLSLTFNRLTGSIPPQLGNLGNLEYLFLSSNQLTGSIPAELGNLTNLLNLNLDSNELTGTIPPELGNLANLLQLMLQSNELTGTIPTELMDLSSLLHLDICYNHLYAINPDLRDFLDTLQPEWENCQCNDIYYRDPDGDGYGNPNYSLLACSQPEGYVTDNTDNCPCTHNPGQEDSDGDGCGDACDGRPDDPNWVSIYGTITYEGTPLCTMVLANGQHMFTCRNDVGLYDLEVPLDENGEITLYGFCSGFSPFKVIIGPERGGCYDIPMSRTALDSREMEITVESEPGTSNPDRVRISGTVNYDGAPLCAMVLANGQNMFSCGDVLGTIDLEAPLDENGEITLYVFCSGFAPYKEVFVP